MLKIGDFAKLFNVSLKTVRFYEEKSLLKPAYIDKFSGYRYYDDDNIETMKKIQYLKSLGFSLDEIKNYNDEMIQTKIEEYKKTIAKLTSNISVLEERLILDNRNVKLQSAREKYITSVRRFYDIEGGIKMFEENEKIYEILSRDTGICLGKDIYLPTDKRGNVNSLVVAGSGSGKSASYVLPNIFRTLGSYVVTDPRGELYAKTHEYMKEKGYIVKAVNYKESEDNYDYDPIVQIRNDKDINVLADIIIGDSNDQFWDESAKLLVKATIYYILEKADNKSLLTLFYLLSDTKEELFAKFDEFEKDSKGYKYSRILRTFPEKTFESIASTALVKLSFVVNKVSDDMDFSNKIDFSELYDKKVIFYITFDENSSDDQRVANIFVSQIRAQLDKRDTPNEKVFVLLDAIGLLGKIDNLNTHVYLAKGRNVSISLISHNLSSLEKIYGDEVYSMLNSIDTQLLLGTNMKSDIEYFAAILGIDKSIVKELKNENLLIFEKGLKAIMAEKDYYFHHEEWK